MSSSLTALMQAANGAAASVSTTGTSTSGTAATAAGNAALQQLGSNFNDFLSLLMTQMKNQDPTQPMDTNAFTTELVQFTGVQQQVATNSSLSQLIGLQQTTQMEQSAGLIGRPVTVSAHQIPLQSGSGTLHFQGNAGQVAAISIVDASGAPLRNALVEEQNGTNEWTWDGKDNAGNTLPDGAYKIAIEQAPADGSGSPSSVTFNVTGTATGLSSTGTVSQLAIGQLAVPFSSVLSVGS